MIVEKTPCNELFLSQNINGKQSCLPNETIASLPLHIIFLQTEQSAVVYYFRTDRAKCRCIFFILTEKSAVVYFFILTEQSAVVYVFILTEKNTFSGRLLLLKNNDLNYFRNERLRDKGSDMLLCIATQKPVSFIP